MTALAAGEPYPCPSCGSTEDWRVDYDQAVSQGVKVVADEQGDPVVVDYRGDESTYDDGSSTNEALRCRNCDYERRLEYVLRIPVGAATPGGSLLVKAQALALSVGYSEDDILKSELFALAGRVDGLVWALREHVEKAEAALAEMRHPPAKGDAAQNEYLRYGELRGALDAWRIALGYWESPPAPAPVATP